MVSRRSVLGGIASLPALAGAASAEPRYRLGVMAAMYRSVPLDDAMQRIRKAGYRYVSMAPKHGPDVVYAPELSKPERKAMLRRIRNLGVEPFLSLGGFGGDPETDAGLEKYIAQLDLCADY
jgi:sugar phosphate isomerase/epimerase